MNTKSFKIHFIAIGIFIAIAFTYSFPALQGNKLVAGDTIQWMGMSQEARAWYEKTGENPMWSNSMFGGMPTVTHYMRGKTNWIYPIQEAISNALPNPIPFFLIAMICFYILMMSWKVNNWLSIFGAVAYAFASYNLQIIEAGHNTKMLSIGYMPLVLAGMHWIYQSKYLHGAAAALIGLSLMISNAMYQIDYYLLIILFIMGIAYLLQALRMKTLKSFAISTACMIGVGLLSVGPSVDQLMLTKEYTSQTMRGGQSELNLGKKEKKKDGGLDKDYAFAWSQSIGETFTLFVPNLYGGGTGSNVGTGSHYFEALKGIGASEEQAADMCEQAPTYWGAQPFLSGPVYIGILIMFFMVLGLFIIKNQLKWFLFGIGILGIMMSWGKHFPAFNYFLFDYLPGYNKFRTPSMTMVIPSLSFGILAIWALQSLFYEIKDNNVLWAQVKKALIIVGGIVAIFGIGGTMFLDFKGVNDSKYKAQFVQMLGNNEQAGAKLFQAIEDDRPSMAMKDAMRSLVFIFFAVAIIWFFIKKKLEMQKALLALGLLMSIDLLSIAWRYLDSKDYKSNDEYEAQFLPRKVDSEILSDTDPYFRVYDLSRDPYNDAMGAYHHKLVGGYHPAKMEAYQDLIDNQLQPGSNLNAQVLNMLNTKYLVFNAGGNDPVKQKNMDACGNAWFVPQIKVVQNADEEMLALNAEGLGDTTRMVNAFRPRIEAVVQNKYWKKNNTSFTLDSSATIRLTKYGLNSLQFESNNNNEGFAVFSDIYYPLGWKAYIDGQASEILKTNYLLRGLNIPAGKHTIEFKFEPETYFIWNKVSLISSILILIVLAGSVFMGFKQMNKKEN